MWFQLHGKLGMYNSEQQSCPRHRVARTWARLPAQGYALLLTSVAASVVVADAVAAAAGSIHSDIQQGFIRAEIISFTDFIACGGETQSKQAGKMRLEQKDYIMQDGDLANFRFNK